MIWRKFKLHYIKDGLYIIRIQRPFFWVHVYWVFFFENLIACGPRVAVIFKGQQRFVKLLPSEEVVG
jgi:hypothetical protein